MIHRNLDLGNIFLNDKMEVKIGNFTEFIEVSENNEHEFTKCGKAKADQSYEVDIKSIGVIIYTLLIGEPPRSHNERILLPDELGINDGARDIIGKILNNDPSNRPCVSEILNSEWLNHGCPIPESLPITCLHDPPSFQ